MDSLKRLAKCPATSPLRWQCDVGQRVVQSRWKIHLVWADPSDAAYMAARRAMSPFFICHAASASGEAALG